MIYLISVGAYSGYSIETILEGPNDLDIDQILKGFKELYPMPKWNIENHEAILLQTINALLSAGLLEGTVEENYSYEETELVDNEMVPVFVDGIPLVKYCLGETEYTKAYIKYLASYGCKPVDYKECWLGDL